MSLCYCTQIISCYCCAKVNKPPSDVKGMCSVLDLKWFHGRYMDRKHHCLLVLESIWHRLMKREPVRFGEQSLQKCFNYGRIFF